jgi:hypothetical protein
MQKRAGRNRHCVIFSCLESPISKTSQIMEQSYKNCQSCGMPMKRDEKGGGSNADGTKSMMYCSHCYQNGQFVLPDISVAEMQARVQGKDRGVWDARFSRRSIYPENSEAGTMAKPRFLERDKVTSLAWLNGLRAAAR